MPTRKKKIKKKKVKQQPTADNPLQPLFKVHPLLKWMEENKGFDDASPELKHQRIVTHPFFDAMDYKTQKEALKYNITKIEEINSETDMWVVDYFDLYGEFQKFNGTKEDIMKFFTMDTADLYYIAKTIIPENNRIDSPFRKQLDKLENGR